MPNQLRPFSKRGPTVAQEMRSRTGSIGKIVRPPGAQHAAARFTQPLARELSRVMPDLAQAPPASTSTTSPRLSKLRAVAERIISQPSSQFYTPGIVIAIRDHRDNDVQCLAVGTDTAGRPLKPDTPFGIASATKLALGLAVLSLVDAGTLDLDAPLAHYLPDSVAAASDPAITLRAVLSHTAGLPLEVPPHLAPYQLGLTHNDVMAACLATPAELPPYTRVQYSNLGYGLLAVLLERTLGMRFPAVLRKTVFDPLGVRAWIGFDLPEIIIAVDDIDSPHAGTDLEPGNSIFWKQLELPWTSITTTARGLLALVDAYVDGAGIISPELASEARTDQTRNLSGGFASTAPFLGFNASHTMVWPQCAWGLGAEVRGNKRPHWTPVSCAQDSFGHIGSSGCVAWCDRDRGVSWAICGVRTTDSGWLTRYGPALGDAARS